MRLSMRWLSSYFLGCDFSLVAFVKNERTSKKITLKFARNSRFLLRNSRIYSRNSRIPFRNFYNLEFLNSSFKAIDFSGFFVVFFGVNSHAFCAYF